MYHKTSFDSDGVLICTHCDAYSTELEIKPCSPRSKRWEADKMTEETRYVWLVDGYPRCGNLDQYASDREHWHYGGVPVSTDVWSVAHGELVKRDVAVTFLDTDDLDYMRIRLEVEGTKDTALMTIDGRA